MALFYTGVLQINNPSKKKYPIRGVDVSHYQAENFCSTVTPVEKMLPPVLQETFDDYDLWIRDVYRKPDPTVKWTFWQYSNRHVLSGYSGNERYIDMNVFCGSEEEFDKY